MIYIKTVLCLPLEWGGGGGGSGSGGNWSNTGDNTTTGALTLGTNLSVGNSIFTGKWW